METVVRVISVIASIVVGAWGLWCTWVAFFGGTFPIPFTNWTTSGGILLGLLFLFIVTPVLTAIASQIFIWIFSGILLLISLATPKQES